MKLQSQGLLRKSKLLEFSSLWESWWGEEEGTWYPSLETAQPSGKTAEQASIPALLSPVQTTKDPGSSQFGGQVSALVLLVQIHREAGWAKL